jgi:hypothetical protein
MHSMSWKDWKPFRTRLANSSPSSDCSKVVAPPHDSFMDASYFASVSSREQHRGSPFELPLIHPGRFEEVIWIRSATRQQSWGQQLFAGKPRKGVEPTN